MEENTGYFYEKLGVIILKKFNYSILHINYHIWPYEIDVICLKNNILHLIEIRKRTTFHHSFTKKKLCNLYKAGELLLIKKEFLSYKFLSIDALVFINPQEYKLWENISYDINI